MIRRAQLFCAITLATACFACAPPPPPPPPPAQAKETAGPQAACTADDFKGKVSDLTDTSFSPGPGLDVPTRNPLPTGSGIPDYAGDLAKVFNAASIDFRNTLCTLDVVYINAVFCDDKPADCFGSSWGW